MDIFVYSEAGLASSSRRLSSLFFIVRSIVAFEKKTAFELLSYILLTHVDKSIKGRLGAFDTRKK